MLAIKNSSPVASTLASADSTAPAVAQTGSEKQQQLREQPANLQSPPLSPLLHVREDRDALAIAHDRQKYLKTLDRARNKARKAFGMDRKALSGSKTKQHQGVQERRITVGEEDKEVDYWLPVDRPVAPTSATVINCIPGSGNYLDVDSTNVEIRLADLVYAPHTRKTRHKEARGGIGGDYEIVPHVRSVIVLDDQQFVVSGTRKTRDMDMDDAWECIDDEEGNQKVTYASIAAAALAGN